METKSSLMKSSLGLSFPRLGFDVGDFVPPSWADKEFACGLCVFLDNPAWKYPDAATAALALIGGVRVVYGQETTLEALHVAGSPLAVHTADVLLLAAERAWNMSGSSQARRNRAAEKYAEAHWERKALKQIQKAQKRLSS